MKTSSLQSTIHTAPPEVLAATGSAIASKLGCGVLDASGKLVSVNASLAAMSRAFASPTAWWSECLRRLKLIWGPGAEQLATERPLTLGDHERAAIAPILEFVIVEGKQAGERLLLVRDVTSDLRAQQSLEQLNGELKRLLASSNERDRRMTDYFESISARLRTPLNTIRGYSELLIEEGAEGMMAADLERIQAASTELLAAIRHIEAQVEAEQARRRLDERLRDIERAMTATLNIHQVCDGLLDTVSTVIPHAGACAWLRRPHGLVRMGLRGHVRVPVQSTTWQQDGPLASAAATGRPVCFKEESSGWSLLAVPLVHHAEVVAVLVLHADSSSTFAHVAPELLGVLSERAGAAIHRARSFVDHEVALAHDEITGVANRRHFMELARREFARAQDRGRTVSLLLFDAVAFDPRAGRIPVGPSLIRRVATACAQVVRDEDVFGDFGEGRFALLLPETGREDAATCVAPRLRRVVTTPMQDGADEITVRLAISVVEATPAEELPALFERAAQALQVEHFLAREKDPR